MRLRALLSLPVQCGLKLALIYSALRYLRPQHTVCNFDVSVEAQHLCYARDILDKNHCFSRLQACHGLVYSAMSCHSADDTHLYMLAGMNAQDAARQVSTCSDQVAQRTQAQIKDFTTSVSHSQ